MARKLIAGNWKMNGLRDSLREIEAIAVGIRQHGQGGGMAEALICPPATLLAAAAQVAGASGLMLGGQDCHTGVSGAHTGDISAQMLRDAGASHVIVGHSERRADHGETDATVQAKALAARAAGLTPVICVGETLAAREAGETLAVIERQVAGSVPDAAGDGRAVIAYEPVWAIGTGHVASAQQIAEVHQAIRDMLTARFGAAGTGMRLLYGGSMKPENAAEILGIANVDGGLIGGASLQAESFLAIYQLAERG